jgi:hypothetical protein
MFCRLIVTHQKWLYLSGLIILLLILYVITVQMQLSGGRLIPATLEQLREEVRAKGGLAPKGGSVDVVVKNQSAVAIRLSYTSWKGFGRAVPPYGWVSANGRSTCHYGWLDKTPNHAFIVWSEGTIETTYSQRVDLKRLADHDFENNVTFIFSPQKKWYVEYDITDPAMS